MQCPEGKARKSARRHRAVGEGVFSSALRKFKSPILGGTEARAFCFFFPKKEDAIFNKFR